MVLAKFGFKIITFDYSKEKLLLWLSKKIDSGCETGIHKLGREQVKFGEHFMGIVGSY